MAYSNIKDENGKLQPALVFSHCQWNHLYGIVSKDKNIEEEKKIKSLEMEQRKDLSRKMADTWENTYINIRKQRFEKRKERLLKDQLNKENRYEQLRLESEKLKKKICEKARQAFFFERDACKTFHIAFRNSEVEAERLAQLEFNEKLKQIDREIETKYAESIISDVQRFHEEQEKERLAFLEKKKRLKIEAKAMLDEARERKRLEKEKLHKEEREDMEILKRQIKQVRANEMEQNIQKRLMARQNLQDNREQLKKFREQLEEEDDEENKVLEIIANGKMTMAKMRKEREEQMLQANRARFQALSNKLSNEAGEKQKKEEDSFERAKEEKYKLEMDTKERQRQHQEMLKKERIDSHLNYLKEQDEKLLKERELLKWEILRRFEREELNNKFLHKGIERKKKQKQLFKESCINQVKEDIDRRMKEEQLDLDACQRAQELWELSDKEFLAYAEMVREESKKKGRPVYPLDAAIYKYKKANALDEKKRNFIWDSKLKRPMGIDELNFPSKEPDQKELLKNCLTVNVIPREDCGCPRKTSGLEKLT